MFSKKDAYEVTGKINKTHALYGKWNEFLQLTRDDQVIELWRFPSPVKNWPRIYYFRPFTL